MEIIWVGPLQISGLLANCLDSQTPFPPVQGSAYLVTQRSWHNQPTKGAMPLYVGGNTGESERFRTRIGELIVSSVGLFNPGGGRHSGGRSIRSWTLKNRINPLDLYLAWVQPGHCHRCLEVELVARLRPLLNERAPSKCLRHS